MPLAAAILLALLISSVPLWAQEQPAPQSPQEPAQNTQAVQKKPATHVASPAKAKTRHRRRPTQKPGAPAKVIVRNGSTTEPKVQISPTMNQQQAVQQRQNTSQLLAVTEANLKKISGQSLTAERKNIVDQIRDYMEQANAADKAGDMQRAQNLASKARLLSDDLVKPAK